MLSLKVHHIGYLVKKTEPAIRVLQALGYEICGAVVRDEIRLADICFLQKDGYRIELIAPYSETSVVYGLLKKYKNCPYHICYETQDFDSDYQTLREEGFLPVDTLTPAPALDGCEVVFMTHASLGMIELIRPR